VGGQGGRRRVATASERRKESQGRQQQPQNLKKGWRGKRGIVTAVAKKMRGLAGWQKREKKEEHGKQKRTEGEWSRDVTMDAEETGQ